MSYLKKYLVFSLRSDNYQQIPLKHAGINNVTFTVVKLWKKGNIFYVKLVNNWNNVKRKDSVCWFRLISVLDICHMPSAYVAYTWYIQVVNCVQIHIILMYAGRLYMRLQRKKMRHSKMKTNSKQLLLLFLSPCCDLKTDLICCW